MSLNPQATADRSSALREELVSKIDAYFNNMESDWKEDDEFGLDWDEPELNFLFEAESASLALRKYGENTLLALKESGMSEAAMAAVITDDGDETTVRETAYYYPFSKGFADSGTLDMLRSIFFVSDLSSLCKGTPNYQAVACILAAAARFAEDRMNRPQIENSMEEYDDYDLDRVFLNADDNSGNYAITPHLADIILRFPDDFERIAHYISSHKLYPGDVDTGHLEAVLVAPAAALEEGVL